MSDESNVETLRQAYADWSESKGASVERWMAVVTDDVELWSIGGGGEPGLAFTSICRCKDDLRRYFDGLHAEWEMLSFTINEYVVERDRVVALGECSYRNRRTGREFRTPRVDVIRFRDGKISSFHEYFDTAKVFAAAAP